VNTYRIENAQGGDLGTYTGSTPDEAIEAMARMAGYASRAEMDREVEGGGRLVVTEVPEAADEG